MKRNSPAMNVAAPVAAVMFTIFLTACNLFASKEDQCLLSTRLSFNDPDSLKVVQNLGDRGKKEWIKGDGFWLRYSSANATGGRVSGTMACEKIEGKWSRSKRLEEHAKSEIFTKIHIRELEYELETIKKHNEAIKACKSQECKNGLHALYGSALNLTGDLAIYRAERKAQELADETVYGGTSDF